MARHLSSNQNVCHWSERLWYDKKVALYTCLYININCIYNELDDSNVFGCVYGLYQGGCDTLPMVLSNEELMLGYI